MPPRLIAVAGPISGTPLPLTRHEISVGRDAANHLTLADPGAVGHAPTAWLILGGIGLFLAGHAAFKAVVWRYLPWTRLAGVIVLLLLLTVAGSMPRLALSACAAVVVIAVATWDYLHPPVAD